MPELPCHRRAADDVFGRANAVSEAQRQQSAGGAQRPLPGTAGDVAAMDVDTRRDMCVRCSRLLATTIADYSPFGKLCGASWAAAGDGRTASVDVALGQQACPFWIW